MWDVGCGRFYIQLSPTNCDILWNFFLVALSTRERERLGSTTSTVLVLYCTSAVVLNCTQNYAEKRGVGVNSTGGRNEENEEPRDCHIAAATHRRIDARGGRAGPGNGPEAAAAAVAGSAADLAADLVIVHR